MFFYQCCGAAVQGWDQVSKASYRKPQTQGMGFYCTCKSACTVKLNKACDFFFHTANLTFSYKIIMYNAMQMQDCPKTMCK